MRQNHLYFSRPILGALVIFVGAASADPAIYLSHRASTIERGAALELQRLWYAASGELLNIHNSTSVSAAAEGFVLGTPQSLPRMNEQWPFGHEPPTADGFVVARAATARPLWIVAAEDPAGVTNGVFGVLEALGFHFGFGEALWPDEPTLQPIDTIAGSHSPVFAVRGLMPQLGALIGASTWEWPDYRAYIDDVIRMRFNAITFRCTDFEPFAAYEFEGELLGGERLPNTTRPFMNGRTMETTEFLAGTRSLFPGPHFGASASFLEQREVSIRASSDVLARAVRYAASRGLQVSLGFEVYGDPTTQDSLDHLAARIQAVLTRYPEINGIWIWEPRGEETWPTLTPNQRGIWSSFTHRWSNASSNSLTGDLPAEAARIGLFTMYARQLVQPTRPDIEVNVAGWRALSGDGFQSIAAGLDHILPDDVGFAAIDTGELTVATSTAFGGMQSNRAKTPVLTLERKSGLLVPQPMLQPLANALNEALAHSLPRVFGAHWRTQAANETVTFLAKRGWQRDLTPDQFLRTRAEAVYGTERADRVTAILLELQQLGFGWTGSQLLDGVGQPKWQAGMESKRADLLRIGYDVRGLLGDAAVQSASQPRFFRAGRDYDPAVTALGGLAREIDYVLALDTAITHITTLLSEEGRRDPDPESWLAQSRLPEAMAHLAENVSSKDDLGAIAMLNLYAWGAAQNALGLDQQSALTLARSTVKKGDPPTLHVLPGRAMAVADSRATPDVRLRVRPIGVEAFGEQRLRPLGNTTFVMAFPRELDASTNLVYGVEADWGFRTRARWPRDFPGLAATSTRHAEPPLDSAPRIQPRLVTPSQPVNVTARVQRERYSVELAWTPNAGELYTVLRDGEVLGIVPGGWFEDTRPTAGRRVEYVVEARRGMTGAPVRSEVALRVPNLPLPRPPADIRAEARANRIVLGWMSDAPQAVQYHILKYNDAGEVIEETYIDADHGQYLQMSDQVTGGKEYEYTVAGVAPDGRIGPASPRVHVISSREPLQPVLQLSFVDEQFLEGMAELAEQGVALGGSGWAELPPQPAWDPTHALTVSCWVKLDDIDGMPVLITKGAWLQSGYFLQIDRDRVRFAIAGIDTLEAGTIAPGQWHLVTATYGFGQLRVYVDGQQTGRKFVSGRPRAGDSPLLVGRYIADEEAYFLRGLMDDIRVYDVALTPAEVEALYAETFRE